MRRGLEVPSIVVAAAKTKSCVRQGLVSMTSVFFTTIVICTMTGIVVITSGYLDTTNLDGGKLSNAAYNAGLPGNLGMYMVSVGLIFFAFTTIISWCYYGERCLLPVQGCQVGGFIQGALYCLRSGMPLSGTAAHLASGGYYQCLHGVSKSDRTFGIKSCCHKRNKRLLCRAENKR